MGHCQEEVCGGRGRAAYDSDSYENHVIELREASSTSPGRRFQRRMECACEDGAGAVEQERQDDGGFEAGAAVEEGRSDKSEFGVGQVVWAKFARFPWWPAQVVDERDLNDDFKCDKPAEKSLAVRFFGTYDYAWVDPLVGLSNFDVKFQDRSRSRKKALSKGIEEAVEFRSSGKLPLSWYSTASDSEQSSQKADANGTKGSRDGSVQAKSENKEPGQRRAARTRKPKVLFEEEDIGHRRPERKLRRVRIMRYLGLAAPYGSPFTLENASKS